MNNHVSLSLRTRSRYTGKFTNAKTDLLPLAWQQRPAVHFLERKLLRFSGSCAACALLRLWLIRAPTTSPICLTFPISITPPLLMSSEIISRTAARATPRKLSLLVRRTTWKQVCSKQSVITYLLMDSL